MIWLLQNSCLNQLYCICYRIMISSCIENHLAVAQLHSWHQIIFMLENLKSIQGNSNLSWRYRPSVLCFGGRGWGQIRGYRGHLSCWAMAHPRASYLNWIRKPTFLCWEVFFGKKFFFEKLSSTLDIRESKTMYFVTIIWWISCFSKSLLLGNLFADISVG